MSQLKIVLFIIVKLLGCVEMIWDLTNAITEASNCNWRMF
jgi:hypothetical protein